MKRKYQVTITFTMDDDFGALIPEHRQLINDLLEQHIIESYVVSLASMTSWITMNAYSAKEARQLLNTSPLSTYWESMDVDEIFVYDSLIYRWPELSYN
jgi:hypothetical protein